MDGSSTTGVLEAALGDHVLTLPMLVLIIAVIAALAVVGINRQFAVRRLRESEKDFRNLYENVNEGIFRSTIDGRLISANPYLVKLIGFDDEAKLLQEPRAFPCNWYVDPARGAEIDARLRAEGQVERVVSEVHRFSTRERMWVEENLRLVRDAATGEPSFKEGSIREVTETIRRLDLQRRYDQIAQAISGCIFQMRVYPDGSSSMPYASPGLMNLFGVSPEEVIADTWALAAAIHPDDQPRIRQTLRECRLEQRVWQLEFRIARLDGPESWVFAHAFPELAADGSTLWHGFLTDVTDRKRSEAKIYDLAFFDSLTGLPNRTRVLEVLRDTQGGSPLRQRWNALLFVDLDQFKLLNDSKGHLAGDRLLQEVAARLQRHVDNTTFVGRYGGDEFVILLQQLGKDRATAEVKTRMLATSVAEELAVPFTIDGGTFQTTASIGITFFTGRDRDVDEVLKQADLAMYQAKSAGGGRIRFFVPEMQADIDERITLRRELREAFDRNKFVLLYQPQIDDQWRCVGAEALIRWLHPVRGEVKPYAFLPQVEPAGLSGMVDRFVLRSACRTLRAWQDDPATRGLSLSVNITADQLGRPEFIEMVEGALKDAGVAPSLLALELTEHVMLEDVVAVGAAMETLKEMGVQLALDDFGTGYSSLTYLRQLPLDILKVDRSFVRDIDTNGEDRAIVRAVLDFAEGLDLAVVAEGVETVENFETLRQLGCRLFQGYLIARPMTHEAFTAFAARTPEERRKVAVSPAKSDKEDDR